ncbi:hypothetical protein CJF30_00001637 [Rutstroemia sp. NJR-2017a BBW]|nr:hypothetical protein CJF30_00001637 [Rutstroemia sp. NJR-2017a BBW]
MESHVQFTVEQLLELHRYWITELFITDGKTEEEIVEILHVHHIDITQNKLHSYLSNWNLLTSRTNTDLDDWILVPSADQLFSIQEDHSYEVDNDIPYESVAYSESIRESYKRRSLAAKTNPATIPDSHSSHFLIPDSTSKKARAHKPSAPFTFSLPSPAHHKSSSVQHLEDVPDRLSPLEVYESQPQNHERLAVELESTAEVWKRIRRERCARWVGFI